MKSSDIHITAILQEMPQPSITKICLKITCLKFHSNFPGANELKWGLVIVTKNNPLTLYHVIYSFVPWEMSVISDAYFASYSNYILGHLNSSDDGDGIFWHWAQILCLLMLWLLSRQSISRHGIGCEGQITCIVVPELILSTWVKPNPKIWFKKWIYLL